MSLVRYPFRCTGCRADEERAPRYDAGQVVIPDYPCLLCGEDMIRVYTAPNLSKAAVPTRKVIR